MSPIRLGLIGLSTASASTNWGPTAHLPYLVSEQGKKHYEIVALCNTSVASGEKSRSTYNLPESVKCYDSPAKLAADENVDMVVNITGVETHYDVLKPVLQAGKDVYTELPLASNMEQMEELMALAREKKVKTIFGMQGQTIALTALLKKTIAEGKIGKVLSTTWTASASRLGAEPTDVGLKMFMDRKTGGNLMSVWFLHTINYIMASLGPISTFHSILANQRPKVDMVNEKSEDPKKIVETVTKDTPDQLLLQGKLESGAVISYHLRGGDAFPGQPALTWEIYGEKGVIVITHFVSVLDIVSKGCSIKMQIFGEKDAQTLELPEDEMSSLKGPSENVGRIYEAVAAGKKGGDGGYPDWEMGFERHELIEEMWKRSDGSEPFGTAVQKS